MSEHLFDLFRLELLADFAPEYLLRPPHPVDDIHHELDRAAAEGLPEGHQDARRDAQRGVRHPAHGKDGHGQEVIPEAGAQNRS